MAFVLDCSVTMAWVFPDEANASTDNLRESLARDSAVVPVLWPIEVANVLLLATRRGRISEEEWPRIRTDLNVLPIDIDLESHGQVLERVLPIAAQYELSVYDAMYLELALRFGLPLATLDRKLNAAGKEAGLELLCS
jgi:predicted nucleic acid-binding protein